MDTAIEPVLEERLEAYHYTLPEELIARQPGARGASRLMQVTRHGGYSHHLFRELPDLLPEGALLIANNSKVFPARLTGHKPSGGKLECLLLTPLPLLEAEAAGEGMEAEAEALIKPVKSVRPGEAYQLDGGLAFRILEKGDFGRCRIRLRWTDNLRTAIDRHGQIPLPPYMRRSAEQHDLERYQTTYARDDQCGSVAAPTAGLHFTDAMRMELAERGFDWAEVTLHVGYGTFSPVREQDIRQHTMHREYVEIPAETAERVREARAAKRPVIAVGTTAARTLEGVAATFQGRVPAHSGWINIFIRPGFQFQVLSGLITNFHLPESTLLMLVSAFAGRETVLAAYDEAVRERYAFFSYGDAMFLS